MQILTKSYPITLPKLPKKLEEMEQLKEYDLTKPEFTAAFALVSLRIYAKKPEEGLRMLAALEGMQELSEKEKEQIADAFTRQPYIADSYFSGAEPDNGYKPSRKAVLTFFETPESREQIEEGILTLIVYTSGADEPRKIQLRREQDGGNWYLHQHELLKEINHGS